MDEELFPGCNYMYHELWIAGTVCISGWTCFLIALTFLGISLCNENKRLRKIQNDVIIFRTSSTNAILEAGVRMTRRPASPMAVVNNAFVPSPPPSTTNFQVNPPPTTNSQLSPPPTTNFQPNPPPTTNFKLDPPPIGNVNKPIEVRPQELPSSRVFPNSFSYTPAGMPVETQVPLQSQGSPNYSIPSPPPVPPRWTNSTQSYSTKQ